MKASILARENEKKLRAKVKMDRRKVRHKLLATTIC